MTKKTTSLPESSNRETDKHEPTLRALVEFARATANKDTKGSNSAFQQLRSLVAEAKEAEGESAMVGVFATIFKNHSARIAASFAKTIDEAATAAHIAIKDFASDRTRGERYVAAHAALESEKKETELATVAQTHGSIESLEEELSQSLGLLRKAVESTAGDNLTVPRKAVPLVEVPLLDGILNLDALLARHLEAIGRPLATRTATTVRRKAAERLAQFNEDGTVAPLWHLWLLLEPAATFPPVVETLARVLWRDVVGPRLERDRKKALVPVRVPTDMSRTFAMARASGGLAVGAHIQVTPPSGMALTLPFDEGLKVSRRTGDMVNLRQVLSPSALRTYLATLVLFQDAGMRDDGSFEIEGAGTVLDVTGAAKHEERKGGRTYQRFATKDTKAVLEHLSSFGKMRVRVVGDLEAAAGDALLDEITDRRNGRIVTYAHSRLIAASLKSSYVQIPRAVCKLSPIDVPLGMGIATIARGKVLAQLRNGKAIEAPLTDWLDACGLDSSEGARKHGRVYWSTAAEDLTRVAEEGRLGQMKVDGKGRGAILTLSISADLRESYGPLLDKSKVHERAKRAAMVADQRKRPK